MKDGHTRHRALCASRRVARLGVLGGGPSLKRNSLQLRSPSDSFVTFVSPGPSTFKRMRVADHPQTPKAYSPRKAARAGAHASLCNGNPVGPPVGSPGVPSAPSSSTAEHQSRGAKRKASVQLLPSSKEEEELCVRGNGLCPTSGWSIDQYCPLCHG